MKKITVIVGMLLFCIINCGKDKAANPAASAARNLPPASSVRIPYLADTLVAATAAVGSNYKAAARAISKWTELVKPETLDVLGAVLQARLAVSPTVSGQCTVTIATPIAATAIITSAPVGDSSYWSITFSAGPLAVVGGKSTGSWRIGYWNLYNLRSVLVYSDSFTTTDTTEKIKIASDTTLLDKTPRIFEVNTNATASSIIYQILPPSPYRYEISWNRLSHAGSYQESGIAKTCWDAVLANTTCAP